MIWEENRMPRSCICLHYLETVGGEFVFQNQSQHRQSYKIVLIILLLKVD